jgi:hypothetical protein
MELVTLDFETYYDAEYSLSKMSTEDYVTDPRFETILVGVRRKGAHEWFSGTKEETHQFLRGQQLNECAVLGHNLSMFDGLVLAHHYDIYPKLYLDTLQLAQARLKPYLKSLSLMSLLSTLNLGIRKGTYVSNMVGRRRESLSSHELASYAHYCLDDVEGTYRMFKFLSVQFPKEEFEVADMVTRMYLEPQLELDSLLLKQILDLEIENKLNMIESLPEGVTKADLMSIDKLAALLIDLDVTPPLKTSPTTGKPTWAFAKTDPAWKDLVEEYGEDPVVGPILAARTGVKSTIIESRAQRLLDISHRYRKFRVPLRYYAAHPGRLGGMEKINAQNLPRVSKKKDRRQLRYAVKAPRHHVVLAGDLSQIEARMNAWVSGCQHLVNSFAAGGDVYSEFSSILHKRPITRADELERFIGKTCILGLGYGMGGLRLQTTLRKDDLKYSLETCEQWVATYRHTYREIPGLWYTCERALKTMARGDATSIGPVFCHGNKIALPNAMKLVYPNLRWVNEEMYSGWCYDFGGKKRTLFGGKLVENFIQALARIVIMKIARDIKRELGLSFQLQAHDELVYVVLERQAEEYAKAMEEIMVRDVSWAPGLPIACEVKFGPTYGDAK